MASSSSAAAAAIPDTEEMRKLIEDAQSRAAAAMGADALRKLKDASFIISGLSGLGVETAKNVILTAIKRMVLHDTQETSWMDLSSQFFLSEADIGTNRATACASKVSELNPVVKLTTETGDLLDFLKQPENLNRDGSSAFDCLVICDQIIDSQLVALGEWAHGHGLKLLYATARGLSGQMFADYGPEFFCNDTTGEQFPNLPVRLIEKVPKEDGSVHGVVSINSDDGLWSHGLQDGDWVFFTRIRDCPGLMFVLGEDGTPKLNKDGTPVIREFKVTVIDATSFDIGDISDIAEEPEMGGIVQGIKKPVAYSFKSLGDILRSPGRLHDSDMMKAFSSSPPSMHYGFLALNSFALENKRLPRPGNQEDADAVVAKAKELFAAGQVCILPDVPLVDARVEMPMEEIDEGVVKNLALFSQGNLNPVCTILGGLLAQEAQKCLTQKYEPLHQMMYFDFTEGCPKEFSEEDLQPSNCRYDGQIAVYGKKLQEKILNLNLFMVGCGALGCEYLKNFAMMGVGCDGGHITVTDMDNIELSNLNRQFLFRAHHVKQMKSAVAVDMVRSMNPAMRATALQAMMAPSTEADFPSTFWEEKDVVVNALDNIKARLYIDDRCVRYRKPLFEAGTESTKCNNALIIPDKTVNYGFHTEKDPPQPKSCTLKSFPYLVDHCIQYVRENIFQEVFIDDPENLSRYMKNPEIIDSMSVMERDNFLMSLNRMLFTEKVTSLEEAVAWARTKFEENFVHDPLSWQHSFPRDALTSTGAPFWSGQKTFPEPQYFDDSNPLHLEFIATASALKAKIHSVAFPEGFRFDKPAGHEFIRKVLPSVDVPAFRPKKQVDDSNMSAEEVAKLKAAEFNAEAVLAKLPKPSEIDFTPAAEEFEKDDDTNYHIDYIHAHSNLRGAVYSIDPADRLKVKLFAGRIIPAIVTSTALICGYSGLEMYKVWADLGFDSLREATVNLGTLMFTIQEPLPAPKWSYKGVDGSEVEFTLWDTKVVDVVGLTFKGLVEKMMEDCKFEMTDLTVEAGGKIKTVWSSWMPSFRKLDDASVSETMLQIEGIRVDPTSGCVEVAPSFTDGTIIKKTDDFGKEYEEEGPEHAPRVVFKLH